MKGNSYTVRDITFKQKSPHHPQKKHSSVFMRQNLKHNKGTTFVHSKMNEIKTQLSSTDIMDF